MSADQDAIDIEMPRLNLIIATYPHKDVWNADEFGLFFRQPPSWTLSHGAVSGFKKEKSRITFLSCCNYDGSERMPLMVVGTAWRPRPFKGKTGTELGFDYHANKKAWMTKELFFGWLKRLDIFIGRTPGRNILLLLDNCSAHGKKEDLPELNNVRVEFLPPNTTSKVEPLDARIIAWVKAKYKRRLLFRVFENIESGKKSIYNVDVLTAMRWTYEEWKNCPSNVIQKCFTHYLRQSGRRLEDIEKEVNEDTLQSMERDDSETVVHYTRAALKDLLNPSEENNVVEEINREDIVREIAGLSDGSDVASMEDNTEEEEEEYYSVEDQLNCLALAKEILERHGASTAKCSQAFVAVQRELRLEKHAKLKQTSISDYFMKQ